MFFISPLPLFLPTEGSDLRLTFYYIRHLYEYELHFELLKSWEAVLIRILCQGMLWCSIDVAYDRQGNEYLNRALHEHYVLKQAVNLWQGSK